jgi:hypothetical protein
MRNSTWVFSLSSVCIPKWCVRFFPTLIVFLASINNLTAQPPKIALEQSANGPADAPQSPEWTKHHLNKTNSHYAPGSVIPYRAIVTNAPINCPLKIRLNFLAVKNCRHAIDFPTNYNQWTVEHFMEFPFDGFFVSIDPLAGLTGDFSGPANIVFPLVPTLAIAGPPADQNTTEQNNRWFLSKYGPQSLSAWNADLSGIEFIGFSEHNNACIIDGNVLLGCNCTIQQTFEVSFTATSLPVVFAWGGHAAYDTLTIDNVNGNFGYLINYTTERGSSGAGGLTKCLSTAQAAGIGGGNDDESFTGGGEEITYSLSGGKPINPTSSNNSELQREEIAISQKASVFPNPNNGSATVMLPPNAESSDIRLTDISGKIIKSWSDYKNQRLELTGLKSGMYFLNIISRSSQNKTVLKVVVLK